MFQIVAVKLIFLLDIQNISRYRFKLIFTTFYFTLLLNYYKDFV
jgi:hypothetical protein